MRPDTDIIKDLTDRYRASTGEDINAILKKGAMQRPSVDMETRIVKGIISTTSPDSEGEVLLCGNFSNEYFPTQISTVYLGHDTKKPVGACRGWSVQDGGHSIYAATYISKTALGQDTLIMLEEGVIKGFSIGAAPRNYGPPTKEEVAEYGKCDTIIRDGIMLEYSITPCPVNAEALVQMVSKARIHRSSAVAFGLPDTPERRFFRAMPIVCEDGSVILPVSKG